MRKMDRGERRCEESAKGRLGRLSGDPGPAAEHQLGWGVRSGLTQGGGQHLYLGVVFPRLFVHPRPRVRERPGTRLADCAMSLRPGMGGQQQVVVSRTILESLRDPRPNHTISARES